MNKSDVIDLMAEVGLKAPVSGDFVFVSWDQLAALVQKAEKRWSTDMTTQTEAQRLAQEFADAHQASTPGTWKKGRTTHHTVTDNNYAIGEFHHAADAQFCDTAHELAVPIVSELRRLEAANAELLALLEKFEYSGDGLIKRYPDELELATAIAKHKGTS